MKKAKLIVGAAASDRDLRYATGLATPDDFVFAQCGEKRVAVLSALEFDRASRQAASGVEVVRSADCGGNSVAAQILFLAKKWRVNRFEVPRAFPLGLADELRASGVTIEACKGIFQPEREFKSDAEVAMIERALRITEKAMLRAVRIVADASVDGKSRLVYEKKLLTSERLRAEIELELLRNGAVSGETIAACGRQSALPHNVGTGAIFAGKPIVIDIFPHALDTGYFGDLTRTLVKGRFGKKAAAAFRAVVAARDLAKTAVRAGAVPADIHALAAAELERHGFATGFDGRHYCGFFHSLGHGVGLDIHETPRIGPSNRSPLRGGEVVTDEPGLYYPDWGGIRMEDMIVVGETSCRTLTKIGDYGEID